MDRSCPLLQSRGEDIVVVLDAVKQYGSSSQYVDLIFEAYITANEDTRDYFRTLAGPSSPDHLSFLRQNSLFQELREILKHQPWLLEPIFHEFDKKNAHLSRLVASNAKHFISLLMGEKADEPSSLAS
jgi:hypothetical protein